MIQIVTLIAAEAKTEDAEEAGAFIIFWGWGRDAQSRVNARLEPACQHEKCRFGWGFNWFKAGWQDRHLPGDGEQATRSSYKIDGTTENPEDKHEFKVNIILIFRETSTFATKCCNLAEFILMLRLQGILNVDDTEEKHDK